MLDTNFLIEDQFRNQLFWLPKPGC